MKNGARQSPQYFLLCTHRAEAQVKNMTMLGWCTRPREKTQQNTKGTDSKEWGRISSLDQFLQAQLYTN